VPQQTGNNAGGGLPSDHPQPTVYGFRTNITGTYQDNQKPTTRMNTVDLLNFMDNDNDYLAYKIGKHLLSSQLNCNRQGSVFGQRTINQGCLQGDQQLWTDYFSENATYPEDLFCQRYRMQQPLFSRILNAVVENNNYFRQKRNAAKQLGFLPCQKVTAAFRMLAYGATSGWVHETSAFQFIWLVFGSQHQF
jgi:hypothetical protein